MILFEALQITSIQTLFHLSHRPLLLQHGLMLNLFVEHLLVALLTVFLEAPDVFFDGLPVKLVLDVLKLDRLQVGPCNAKLVILALFLLLERLLDTAHLTAVAVV